MQYNGIHWNRIAAAGKRSSGDAVVFNITKFHQTEQNLVPYHCHFHCKTLEY